MAPSTIWDLTELSRKYQSEVRFVKYVAFGGGIAFLLVGIGWFLDAGGRGALSEDSIETYFATGLLAALFFWFSFVQCSPAPTVLEVNREGVRFRFDSGKQLFFGWDERRIKLIIRYNRNDRASQRRPESVVFPTMLEVGIQLWPIPDGAKQSLVEEAQRHGWVATTSAGGSMAFGVGEMIRFVRSPQRSAPPA